MSLSVNLASELIFILLFYFYSSDMITYGRRLVIYKQAPLILQQSRGGRHLRPASQVMYLHIINSVPALSMVTAMQEMSPLSPA